MRKDPSLIPAVHLHRVRTQTTWSEIFNNLCMTLVPLFRSFIIDLIPLKYFLLDLLFLK